MRIMVDQEGLQVIKRLCDIALKAGGLSNFEAVRAIIGITEVISQKKKKDRQNYTTPSPSSECGKALKVSETEH